MTGLPPRAVLVQRRTELTELLERHGSRGQAEFFLRSRGRSMADVQARHDALQGALATVGTALPRDWRRAGVERAELARFLFEPGDVVIVVGPDGLVANAAKYLDGQPVIGVDPEPGRNPAVLVRHASAAVAGLVRSRPEPAVLAMAEATADDGQRLIALNEVYLGQPNHQTARYILGLPGGRSEAQASSGLIAGTGTGATGWCRSAWLERHSPLSLPAPSERRLTWFVREAWPSPLTGTDCTEGELGPADQLTVTVASDRLVVFGDGVESDSIALSWGQSVTIGVAGRTLRLVT